MHVCVSWGINEFNVIREIELHYLRGANAVKL